MGKVETLPLGFNVLARGLRFGGLHELQCHWNCGQLVAVFRGGWERDYTDTNNTSSSYSIGNWEICWRAGKAIAGHPDCFTQVLPPSLSCLANSAGHVREYSPSPDVTLIQNPLFEVPHGIEGFQQNSIGGPLKVCFEDYILVGLLLFETGTQSLTSYEALSPNLIRWSDHNAIDIAAPKQLDLQGSQQLDVVENLTKTDRTKQFIELTNLIQTVDYLISIMGVNNNIIMQHLQFQILYKAQLNLNRNQLQIWQQLLVIMQI